MVLRQGFTSLLARSVLDGGSGLSQVFFLRRGWKQSLENSLLF